MKHYYIGYENGNYDFVKAISDKKAYTKARNTAKELHTSVKEMHEIGEEKDMQKNSNKRIIL